MKLKVTDFDKVFYVLSLFFVLYFYLIPLTFVFIKTNVTYLELNLANSIELSSGVYALVAFVFGYLVAELCRPLFNNVIKYRVYQKPLKESRIFWLCLSLVFIGFIFYLFQEGRQEEAYEIRKGHIQGGHFQFLLNILFGFLKLLVVTTLFNQNRRKLIMLFLIMALTVDLLGSIGRANLILSLSLIFLHITSMRTVKYAWVCVFSMGILLPIILSLKSIIYSFSVNGEFPSIITIMDGGIDFDLYLANFGHPLVSLLYVDGLIDKIGFRYFYDYIQGWLFYLRPFGINVGDSLTYYNTENIIGIRESIIPPGYLAFGYVQLSYLGVFISGMSYRFVGVFAKVVYYKISGTNETIKFMLAFMAANTFYHGEIRIMVMNFFIPLGILFVFNRKMYK
ncbi:MAG: hypothetical protein HRT38_06220 [Alteromonadaceae bacterium]|nr:hypothetical protein [Alteromonadaceae bacterium]